MKRWKQRKLMLRYELNFIWSNQLFWKNYFDIYEVNMKLIFIYFLPHTPQL